ncbi:MAG: hypothetical protein LBK95_07805 [Bifidobacteriaceae bacterium]|jgi:hypothetical protein|nr:hypothetical protein [Bifidobacteriaceae bacterium]
MKRILTTALALSIGLATLAFTGACSNSRVEVFDWSALDGGFDQLGLDWGMGVDQVPVTLVGEAPPEGADRPTAYYDVVAFGVPWRVTLSFTDDSLYSVGLRCLTEDPERKNALRSGEGFDEEMLELALIPLFDRLSAKLEESYGPAPSAEDDRTEWDAGGTFASLKWTDWDSLADEIYLEFRPSLLGTWELSEGAEDFGFEVERDYKWARDDGYDQGRLAFEFSDFDHMTVVRIIGSATMTRNFEYRQWESILAFGTYEDGLEFEASIEIVGDRLVMELMTRRSQSDPDEGPTVVFERRDGPIATPVPSAPEPSASATA